MKKRLIYLMLCVLTISTVACESTDKTQEATPKEARTEKDDDFTGELPELSVYHLPSDWTTQNGEEIQLEDLRGDIVVAVMIYTQCKAACPRLIADVQRIKSKVKDETNKQVKYVFVSIDPAYDSPARLKEFAIENEMDSEQWLFLTGDVEDTREFASVLGVGYKRIDPIDFSHSNIISVFNQNGELTFQKEGLDVDDDGVVEAIEELAI